MGQQQPARGEHSQRAKPVPDVTNLPPNTVGGVSISRKLNRNIKSNI